MSYAVRLNVVVIVCMVALIISCEFLGGGSSRAISGDQLGLGTLSKTRGTLPNYYLASNTNVCTCANAGGGFTCVCFENAGADCVVCQGQSIASVIYTSNGGGNFQPAGAGGQCSTLEKFTGTCNDSWVCADLTDTETACTSTYPYAIEQFIGRNTPVGTAGKAFAAQQIGSRGIHLALANSTRTFRLHFD